MQDIYEALPYAVRSRLGRMRQKADRERSLLGYLIAARGIEYFGVDHLDWRHLRWSEFGRPSLPLGIDFNISHAGDRVICAVTAGGTVGVDIEPLRQLDLNGMDQYMNVEQWREISCSANASEMFLRYWTLKESVVKCEGTGLSLPVQEIEIAGGQASLAGRVWYVQELPITDGFVAALAASAAVGHLDVNHWQT